MTKLVRVAHFCGRAILGVVFLIVALVIVGVAVNVVGAGATNRAADMRQANITTMGAPPRAEASQVVLSGSGNGVVPIDLNGRGGRLHIVEGGRGHYFTVSALGRRGPHGPWYRKRLVNAVGPFDGTVLVSRDAFTLKVWAVGLWTISTVP